MFLSVIRYLFALGFSIGCTVLIFSLGNMNITDISVSVNSQYANEEVVKSIIDKNIKYGFILTNVATIRTELEKLPLIKNATVSKKWPKSLNIKLKEESLIARMYDGSQDYLITNQHKNILFQTNNFTYLPLIYSNVHEIDKAMVQFNNVTAAIKNTDLVLQELNILPSSPKTATFRNGMTIILGSNDVHARLARFVTAYRSKLCKLQNQAVQVDLRYPDGVSLG